MAAFTSGPWYSIGHSILGERTHCVITSGTDERGNRILKSRDPVSGLLVPLDDTPNGRLILAATDMYDALKTTEVHFRKIVESYEDDDPVREGIKNYHGHIVDLIHAALAKATGESKQESGA